MARTVRTGHFAIEMNKICVWIDVGGRWAQRSVVWTWGSRASLRLFGAWPAHVREEGHGLDSRKAHQYSLYQQCPPLPSALAGAPFLQNLRRIIDHVIHDRSRG